MRHEPAPVPCRATTWAYLMMGRARQATTTATTGGRLSTAQRGPVVLNANRFESESESGGSEPPQASQLPRFTSSFDPFGSLDALALVQPRPRDPGSFRLALQASMLTPIHSNMCYTCATDACNATPVCFKLVGTRSPPIGTVKRRALADFLPINTRSTLGFDPGSHGTLASSLSTKAHGM